MNQILIVIPFCKDDAKQAERLIDWIFHLHGRKPLGHVLLCASSDVHQEMVDTIKVSAGIAFESFDAVRLGPAPGKSKDEKINWMFKNIALHIAKAYRIPWFWCEPDFTPLSPIWIESLMSSYYSQQKRYCGSQIKAGDVLFPARGIVYPHDAAHDYAPHCDSARPFNVSANAIVSAMTKTRLVREMPITSISDYDQIGKEAIGVHSDKQGIALNARESAMAIKKK